MAVAMRERRRASAEVAMGPLPRVSRRVAGPQSPEVVSSKGLSAAAASQRDFRVGVVMEARLRLSQLILQGRPLRDAVRAGSKGAEGWASKSREVTVEREAEKGVGEEARRRVVAASAAARNCSVGV